VNMSETTGQPKLRLIRGSWHEQARQMRADGLTYHEIGRRIGVSGPAVYFALNPERRYRPKKAEAVAPAQIVKPPQAAP